MDFKKFFENSSLNVYDLHEIDSFDKIKLPYNLSNKNLMLCEIAGRDSIAASIMAAKNCDFDVLIPSIVFTGPEYGDLNSIMYNLDYLNKIINQNNNVKLEKSTVIYDLKLWNLMNARYTSEIIDKFGFYSPCIGCHIYTHILRVPIAKKLGIPTIITGERIDHNGKQKINQLEYVLDTYKKVLNDFGINLYMPLKNIGSNDEIQNIVGGKWSNSSSQLECVMSGNYCDVNDNINIEKSLIKRYCDRFIYPLGKELLNDFLYDKTKNYNEIINNILNDV
jgi:hypothetical protein